MKKIISLLLLLFFCFPAAVLAVEDTASADAEVAETSPEARSGLSETIKSMAK